MENCVAPGLDEFDVLLEVVVSLVRVAKMQISLITLPCADAQADLRLHCDTGQFVGFVVLQLICFLWRTEENYPEITIWAVSWQNQQNDCAPSEDRSALASAQSDQSLHCPHEESLGP